MQLFTTLCLLAGLLGLARALPIWDNEAQVHGHVEHTPSLRTPTPPTIPPNERTPAARHLTLTFGPDSPNHVGPAASDVSNDDPTFTPAQLLGDLQPPPIEIEPTIPPHTCLEKDCVKIYASPVGAACEWSSGCGKGSGQDEAAVTSDKSQASKSTPPVAAKQERASLIATTPAVAPDGSGDSITTKSSPQPSKSTNTQATDQQADKRNNRIAFGMTLSPTPVVDVENPSDPSNGYFLNFLSSPWSRRRPYLPGTAPAPAPAPAPAAQIRAEPDVESLEGLDKRLTRQGFGISLNVQAAPNADDSDAADYASNLGIFGDPWGRRGDAAVEK
ncbi:hypothetical protein V8E36_000569 [Tilletia maclaganii]